MHIPEHVRAQLERIRAEGEQQIERLRADAIAEALAMAQGLRGRDTDLIPLRLLCEHLAYEAMQAEPLTRRKNVAHYETARVAVKNAKAAIRAGNMTPRDQGAGLPIDLSHWCAEGETLRSIKEFMPHSRVMVRRSDARKWFESMGADAPGVLQCKQIPTAPAEEQPAEREAPAPQPPAPDATPSESKGEALSEYDALLAGGMSKNEAGKRVGIKYGIPRSTLRDRIKRRDHGAKPLWCDPRVQAQKRAK